MSTIERRLETERDRKREKERERVLSITFSLHCFCDSGMDPILAQDKDLLRRVLSKVHGSGAGSPKVMVIYS